MVTMRYQLLPEDFLCNIENECYPGSISKLSLTMSSLLCDCRQVKFMTNADTFESGVLRKNVSAGQGQLHVPSHMCHVVRHLVH